MTQPESLTPPPSTDLPARIARLERRFDNLVGMPPDAISGRGGTGLVQAVLDIRNDFKILGDRLAALTSVFQTDIASRKAEAEAREKRREPWSRAAWMVAGSAIGVLTSSSVGAAIYWLTHR